MGSLLNFRCPDELWEAVEKIGKERHPGGNHHRSKRDYDLTSTMLDIVRAGIAALEDDPSLLNKTDSKTLNKTEVQEMIQEAIAASKTERQTIDKTEIQSMIQAAVASEFQKSMTFNNEASTNSNLATKKDLVELEETLLSLIEEKQTTPVKEKVNLDSPDSYNQTNEPIAIKRSEVKTYEDSVKYIIELHRNKKAQTKIAEILNENCYATKAGTGKWTQSMVSGVITSRTAKFTAKN